MIMEKTELAKEYLNFIDKSILNNMKSIEKRKKKRKKRKK
jgi:spermidine/putrescine-binding protein